MENNKVSFLDLNIADAKHRINHINNKTDGKFYLSYSGGKDSSVLKKIIEMMELDIPLVFANTGVESSLLLDFVKKQDEVQIVRPKIAQPQVLKKYGYPVISKAKSDMLRSYHKKVREFKETYSKAEIDKLTGIAHEKTTDLEALHKYINSIILAKPGGKIAILILSIIPDVAKSIEHHRIIPKVDKEGKVLQAQGKLANGHMHMIHPDIEYFISGMCCEKNKKAPLKEWLKEQKYKGFITGERMSEGGARKLQAEKRIKQDKSLCHVEYKGYMKTMPLIDWDNNDIEEFVEKYNVPLSDNYTIHKAERTGCVNCLFPCNLTNKNKQLYENMKYSWKFEPKKYNYTKATMQMQMIDHLLELPFDEDYMKAYYKRLPIIEKRRYEMMLIWRPDKAHKWKPITQLNIFDDQGDEQDV